MNEAQTRELLRPLYDSYEKFHAEYEAARRAAERFMSLGKPSADEIARAERAIARFEQFMAG